MHSVFFVVLFLFFFFKQKTAYEMRISDWSSDVCSSDLSEMMLIRRTCLRPSERFTSIGLTATESSVRGSSAAVVLVSLRTMQTSFATNHGFPSRVTTRMELALRVGEDASRAKQSPRGLRPAPGATRTPAPQVPGEDVAPAMRYRETDFYAEYSAEGPS